MLDSIPYRPLKHLARAIRIRYYTQPWPSDVPSIIVDESAEFFEAMLRNWYGFEGLILSYHYEGEVLNLRRPDGQDPAGRQFELHVRGRPAPDGEGLELIAHVEPSRYEHKRAHIDRIGLRWIDEAELKFLLDQEPRRVPETFDPQTES